jgi:deoxyribodipyrimidine photo-lyase
VRGPALVWFRDDLRVTDNPALNAAADSGAPVLCFFVLDDESPGLRPLGSAARWWLHGSLLALRDSLRERGAELLVFAGESRAIAERIVVATRAESIHWNRRYAAGEIAIDTALKQRLSAAGVQVRSFNGRLLHEPWDIVTRAGTPFQVFTPYARAVFAKGDPARPLAAPRRIEAGEWPASVRQLGREIPDLRLEPDRPDWAAGFREVWRRGEPAALERLDRFVVRSLSGYAANRDRPAVPGTSRLSPHLRFGEISPRQLWHTVRAADCAGRTRCAASDMEKLLTEIVWRDFCYQLLHQHPALAERPHDDRFERFPWRSDEQGIDAWKRGRTGYPIVDAGMRQLWRTGWMHNRVRMVTASFLVKHLLVDWRIGEAWFWDTLVDADPANNAFSWQWISGSGPDSAPFHRIFNPVLQGEKFDPGGEYVRAFVPELSRMPASSIHKPWEASAAILRSAQVSLGETYPAPVVRHEHARERALNAFRALRASDPSSPSA